MKYKESLKKDFNEEQLYYFYTMKLLGFDDVLRQQNELVTYCRNQVLISYYLMENWFSLEQVEKLKQQKDEKLWFQSYHLILYMQELFNNMDNSIDEYLLPSFAKKDAQKNAYREFYKKNLQAKNSIVISIDEVKEELYDYLNIRFEQHMR